MGGALHLQFFSSPSACQQPPCIMPKAVGIRGALPTHLGGHSVAKLRNAVGQVQTLQGSEKVRARQGSSVALSKGLHTNGS